MKFPRWLSWLFVLFFVYLMIAGNQSSVRQQAVRQKPGETTTPPMDESYPKIHALLNGERWMRSVNPDYRPPEKPCGPLPKEEGKISSYAVIDEEGTGSAAQCGDKIDITITPWHDDGSAAPNQQRNITLGDQKDYDALLVGITPGETRTLFFRSHGNDAKLLLKDGHHSALTVKRTLPETKTPAKPSDQ